MVTHEDDGSMAIWDGNIILFYVPLNMKLNYKVTSGRGIISSYVFNSQSFTDIFKKEKKKDVFNLYVFI